jgi:hypothetical protein
MLRLPVKSTSMGIVIFLCGLCAMVSLSMAAEYYLSSTGNDTEGTGPIDNPCGTIQHMPDSVAVAGGILKLQGGAYHEAIEIGCPHITIRSRSGEWPVIQCPRDNMDIGEVVSFDVDPEHSDRSRLEGMAEGPLWLSSCLSCLQVRVLR